MRQLAHCLRKDIQHTLIEYLSKEMIQFMTKPSSHDIGELIVHDGSGSRKGWIGVLSRKVDEAGRVTVIWMLDGNGKSIREDLDYHNPEKTFGKQTTYSLNWYLTNTYTSQIFPNYKNLYLIHYNKVFQGSLLEYDLNNPDNIVQRTPEPLPSDRFIIWSPQGTRNPKGEHSCKKVATKVAVDMAIKHDQDFYVCQLVTVAKPLKKAKITQLYKDK